MMTMVVRFTAKTTPSRLSETQHSVEHNSASQSLVADLLSDAALGAQHDCQ